MRSPLRHRHAGWLIGSVMLAGCAQPLAVKVPQTLPEQPAAKPVRQGLEQIQHIVVIDAGGRSFDHLFGLFPGAEGTAQATFVQKTQVDYNGIPLPSLPPVYDSGRPSAKYPLALPNGPFRIDATPVNRRIDEGLPSPIRDFWRNQEQISGGRNNRFVAMGTAGAWAMGTWDGAQTKLWKWAQDYTLADHFFMGAFGGSFLNLQWLVCACTPVFENAPEALRPQLDDDGKLQKRPRSPRSVMSGPVQVFDGSVTPDGHVVNTLQPPYQPSGIAPAAGGSLDLADPAKNPLPPQTAKTVGDTLSAKGIGWAWYAGGWNAALADGRRAPDEKRQVIGATARGGLAFQPHQQPFNDYAQFAPGTANRAEHLKDDDDFVAAIDAGTLPAVSFYQPVGLLKQRPFDTDLAQDDDHLDEILTRLRSSPLWPTMLVIVTYADNGGYWDHVPPPAGPGWGDRWGPGTRVPTLLISPFARRGFVDKTTYDTTSILKLITRRFALEPLPGVRANVGDLTNALDLTQQH